MAVATQYATGRRKCAIARAWVTGTAGEITVNEKPLEKAFPRLTLRQIIQLPLEMAGVMGKYSIKAIAGVVLTTWGSIRSAPPCTAADRRDKPAPSAMRLRGPLSR